MKVVEVEDESDQPVRYYVFRFRTNPPHWAAKDGWMAAVAGPFGDSDADSEGQLDGTFSMFRSWEECDAHEHLARIRKLLSEMPAPDGMRSP